MDQLININTSDSGEQTVSARELHAFLDVQQRFNDWINFRIQQYGFIERQDYGTFTEKSVKATRPRIEYVLTISTAKELAMVEGGEKGRRARLYFIECEKIAKQHLAKPSTAVMSRDQIVASALKIVYEELQETKGQLAEANQKLEKAAPVLEYADTVLAAQNVVATTVLAQDFGLSAIRMNRLLKEKGIQRKVGGIWVLTAKYADRGYTKMVTTPYLNSLGEQQASELMYWTQRGRAFVHWFLSRFGYEPKITLSTSEAQPQLTA